MHRLEERLADCEARLRRYRLLNAFGLLGLLMVATLGWSQNQGQQLRARSLIIEDSLGRPRIVLGAPLRIPSREGAEQGPGVAVLSETGTLRVAMGAPAASPQVSGKILQRDGGGSAGFNFADADGNERGGMGTFGDGRANVCVDYARGEKEAVCLFVFPDDQMAGVTVNGHPRFGRDQANLMVNALGLAQVKIASTSGRERAILRTDGQGPAELILYDTVTKKYVNVMPPLPQR